MKRACLILSTFILFSASPSLADNIGYIDMGVILTELKMVGNFEKNINKKKEDFKKLFEKKQEKLAKAKEKKKTDEEIQAMIEEMEKELKPKQEEIGQLEAGFEQQLILTITSAAQTVSKEFGIDVVMDKRFIFHGGFDLTSHVIKEINE